MAAAATDVKTIAASLRSCSLTEDRGKGHSHSPPLLAHLAEVNDDSDVDGRILVELNSEVALPVQWEQCLDLLTGEIYYINWENGERTNADPRSTTGGYISSNHYYDDDDDGASDEYSCSLVGSGEDYGISEETEYSSSHSSASPSRFSSAEEPISEGHTLVAAGCKACFVYFMVAKRVDSCPKCAGALLHLGRNGYF